MLKSLAQVCFVVAFSALGFLFDRNEFWSYFPLYLLMFGAYLIILRKKEELLISSLLIAVLLRIMSLAISPELSDDFYRFHWDGILTSNAINPYEQSPAEIIQQKEWPNGIDLDLYEKLNSPNYKSVYPPVSQLIFSLGALISPNDLFYSMLSMKTVLLLFELGSMFLIILLLRKFKLNEANVLWYAWNPLVIVEGSLNMHFEIVVIFFLLLFSYLLLQKKIIYAGFAFSLACLTKLLPFIFLPLICLKLGFKKASIFLLALFSLFALAFWPFISSAGISGMIDSFGLYFKVFEFNAGIYYLFSGIGEMILGYNPIAYVGPILAIISTAGILVLSFVLRKQKMAYGFVAILLCYLLFATTVHPWYILVLVAFGLFTNTRFWLWWSLLIFISYNAYQYPVAKENEWLIVLEYSVLLISLIWDYKLSDRSYAH